MDLSEKKLKIEERKKKLDSEFNDYTDKQNYLIKELDRIIDNHNNFMNFVEIMKIYEIYKWDIMKEEYMELKKKFNKDKKKLSSITDMYSELIYYYSPDMIEFYNKNVKTMSETDSMLAYKFVLLQKTHSTCQRKCKLFIKGDEYYIVEQSLENKDKMKPIIEDLYKIYSDYKELNKQFDIIRAKKRTIKVNLTNIMETSK
jgi:hypothetical protein